jgi:ubiquinone/menaquinone biosynthesis C-methylase UbiE
MVKIKLDYKQGAATGTHEKCIELLLKNVKTTKTYTYLDIGCGEGGLVGFLKKKLKFNKIIACDIDITRFKTKGVKPIKVDVNKGLPFKDGSIDIITCVELIEHIENFFYLIREIKRVLKKGGICILTTPNLNSWYSRIRYLFTGVPSYFDNRCYVGSGHINPIFDWNLIRFLDKEKLYYERYWNKFPLPYTKFQLPFRGALFGEINIWLICKK